MSEDPLLVSVRSGAKFSMPGMMKTVLNIGLNDASVVGLAAASGDERFAWDSYRRLIQMFGKTVLDVDGEHFSAALEAKKAAHGIALDYKLDVEALTELVEEYKAIVAEHAGIDFPQDPRTQLDMATEAVFRSWNTERAHIYQHREKILHDLGTAVNVCTMCALRSRRKKHIRQKHVHFRHSFSKKRRLFMTKRFLHVDIDDCAARLIR